MSGTTFLLIILNVILTAGGQVLLKAGMISPLAQSAISRHDWSAAGIAVLLNPMILAGLLAYAVSLILWLVVLARIPVSTAYPFVAMSIVLTSVSGRFFFDETFSVLKLGGTILIVIGVAAISRG